MKKVISIVVILILFSACREEKSAEIKALNDWYFKDFKKDSVLGLSLTKLYNSDIYKQNSTNETVLVAVIDTEIDTNHEDFDNIFWKNNEEQPNGRDDDDNGYIDDLYGWNFIGNSKGESIIFSNFSFIKKIKQFDSIFKGKDAPEISAKDSINFANYQRALKDYDEKNNEIKGNYEYIDFLKKGYPKAKKTVDSILEGKEYTFKDADSLYQIYKDKDSIIAADVYFMHDFLKYEMDGVAEEFESDMKNIERYSNNIKYDDRAIIGDDVNNINDTIYGNNLVNKNLKELSHGTRVTSIITANNKNDKGINGIYNNIKILPLCVAPKYGPETDKDLALAIKYAVNKGAKIINISLGRSYEFNYKFVEDALRYAAKNNVMVVKGAGNSSQNLDNILTYPNKFVGKDTLDNFIVVGASGKNLNSSKPFWASYGKNYVDLFAPGDEMRTAYPFNKYKPDAGSSLSAAVTSGVAAMLLSKYPDLKPKDIIEILKNSSMKIDAKVLLDYDDENKVSFSELSISGGILNAYEAYKLANEKSISQKTK